MYTQCILTFHTRTRVLTYVDNARREMPFSVLLYRSRHARPIIYSSRNVGRPGRLRQTFIKINVCAGRFRNHERQKLYNNNKPISLTFGERKKKRPREPVARARSIRHDAYAATTISYCRLFSILPRPPKTITENKK